MKLTHILLLIAVLFSSVAMTRFFDSKGDPLPLSAISGTSSIEIADMVYSSEGKLIKNPDISNSGGPQYIIYDSDNKAIRLKNEAERVWMQIKDKKTALYQKAQYYIFSRGYDDVTLMRMSIYLSKGNEAQQALAAQVLLFTDKVTTEGYYMRKMTAEALEDNNAATQAALDSISEDFTNFDSSDPCITLINISQAQ